LQRQAPTLQRRLLLLLLVVVQRQELGREWELLLQLQQRALPLPLQELLQLWQEPEQQRQG